MDNDVCAIFMRTFHGADSYVNDAIKQRKKTTKKINANRDGVMWTQTLIVRVLGMNQEPFSSSSLQEQHQKVC